MASTNITVVGLQWGDEGKGKIVDALARTCRYVVRFCGGANAGHTVAIGDETFAMHLIPCGILSEGVLNVIGNGVAFDPAVAAGEIDMLQSRGIAIGRENLRISRCAHLVMPWHKLQDTLSEKSLADGKKIGTTARGIGPCYSDKANRSTAIRAEELLDLDAFAQKVRDIADVKSKIFSALYGADPIDADAIIEEYSAYGKLLAPMIDNTGELLRKAVYADEPILFEGGQGSMLDIDHGTYPFVTSSPVTACGVANGAGVPPWAVGQIVGIIKAYTSRVGEGPFPTEQENEIGETLRERGHEYGTTTGRPRRCGWFDAFAVRYAVELSGVHELTVALLDVLTGMDEVKFCVGYRVDGKEMECFDPAVMARVEPIYKTLPGWTEDITGCKTFDELPAAAKDYIAALEETLGRPVGFISVGPERMQTIVHHTQIEGLK